MAVVYHPASSLVAKLEGVHLFHFDGAPCAQRVRFALYEKGLPRGREVQYLADDDEACCGENGRWVSRRVSLVKKEHMTQAYGEIHPNLVVPALVHDGVLHIESMDIVEYLDDAFGGTPLIPKYDHAVLEDSRALTRRGEDLHRSVRFVTFRWGLRGLARLSSKEENHLRKLMADTPDGESLVEFYTGYDNNTIPESVYIGHLDKLNAAFSDLEARLQDGRAFLSGANLTMADVIWAMKTLRLSECGYPFQQCFPACAEWYTRLSSRQSFQEGVLGKHRLTSKTFCAKAAVEHWLGIGLKGEVLQRMA